MTNWNNSRKRLKIFTKEFWKEYKWQDILINLLIYFAVFSSLLLIDLLTKWGLYIGDKPNEILANYKILGIRSLLHRGTTLEIGLTLPGLHTITFLIIISSIYSNVCTIFYHILTNYSFKTKNRIENFYPTRLVSNTIIKLTLFIKAIHPNSRPQTILAGIWAILEIFFIRKLDTFWNEF